MHNLHNLAIVPKETLKKYQVFTLKNLHKIPQLEKLSAEDRFAIEVVGHVLPFRVNNYVIDELIDWDNVPNDPIYVLTFPQKEMLKPEHFNEMAHLLENNADKAIITETANRIRWQLNPHPAGQMEHNVPELNGVKLTGIQHKYRETALFFPTQGQTCHAYCTFCFRWPQFVGIDELKFAMQEVDLLIQYVQSHPEITDILFTGGDPMVMKGQKLAAYIDAILEANIPHLKTIRIGSKALAYWPYKFTTDEDASVLLKTFEKVQAKGKNLAYMAHFNHPNELDTPAVKEAVKRIRATGAQIRTQSPVMQNLNADADTWAIMWQKQVDMGMIPYYMFIARDTGAQAYFGVPLAKAWDIYRNALKQVSGLARTVRGPSMSAAPGKVHVLGVEEIANEKVFVLQFLQGRNPDWIAKPFFAKYDENAMWLDDLKPAFGQEKFFFES